MIFSATFPEYATKNVLAKLENFQSKNIDVVDFKFISICNDFLTADSTYCPTPDLGKGEWTTESKQSCKNECEAVGAQCCGFTDSHKERKPLCRASSGALRDGCPGCTAGLTFSAACSISIQKNAQI